MKEKRSEGLQCEFMIEIEIEDIAIWSANILTNLHNLHIQ